MNPDSMANLEPRLPAEGALGSLGSEVLPWSNPRFVRYSPVACIGLLEAANVAQLVRMWIDRTAAGQSLGAWFCVNIALLLWWNFYRVCTPAETLARVSAEVGLVMNAYVVLTVLYFRHLTGVAHIRGEEALLLMVAIGVVCFGRRVFRALHPV